MTIVLMLGIGQILSESWDTEMNKTDFALKTERRKEGARINFLQSDR